MQPTNAHAALNRSPADEWNWAKRLQVLLEPAEEVGADHPVFATLAADAGLDAAVPYIVTMIARGARENPHDLPLLWRLLWAAHSLIRNQTNNAAAYLSQLLPALLTLLLNNCLGPSGVHVDPVHITVMLPLVILTMFFFDSVPFSLFPLACQ